MPLPHDTSLPPLTQVPVPLLDTPDSPFILSVHCKIIGFSSQAGRPWSWHLQSSYPDTRCKAVKKKKGNGEMGSTKIMKWDFTNCGFLCVESLRDPPTSNLILGVPRSLRGAGKLRWVINLEYKTVYGVELGRCFWEGRDVADSVSESLLWPLCECRRVISSSQTNDMGESEDCGDRYYCGKIHDKGI